jgi:hypothetical protein
MAEHRPRRYDKSSMKTKPDAKKEELFHADSRFLLVELSAARVKKPKGGTKEVRELVGYAMFRFDHEEDLEGNEQEVFYMCVRFSRVTRLLKRCEGLNCRWRRNGKDRRLARCCWTRSRASSKSRSRRRA